MTIEGTSVLRYWKLMAPITKMPVEVGGGR